MGKEAVIIKTVTHPNGKTQHYYEVVRVSSMRLEGRFRTVQFRTHFKNGEINWEPASSFEDGMESPLIQKYKNRRPEKFERLMKRDLSAYYDKQDWKERQRAFRKVDKKYEKIVARKTKRKQEMLKIVKKIRKIDERILAEKSKAKKEMVIQEEKNKTPEEFCEHIENRAPSEYIEKDC